MWRFNHHNEHSTVAHLWGENVKIKVPFEKDYLKDLLLLQLLIAVVTQDVAIAFPHTVFAKKLIEIQKPVVEAKLRAAHETKALIKAKAADAAGKGVAAVSYSL